MAKKPIPMPIEVVFDHPALIMAPGPVHRAIALITMAFWRSGRAPEPMNDLTLATLAKLPPSHWRPLKSACRAILDEVLPELWRRRQIIQAQKDNFARVAAQNGRKGQMALTTRRERKAMQKTIQISAITDVSVINHHTPSKAARHVDHRAALPPHELAAITATPDQPKMTLTE